MLFASLLSLVLMTADFGTALVQKPIFDERSLNFGASMNNEVGGKAATEAIIPFFSNVHGGKVLQIRSSSPPVSSFDRQRCRGIADLSISSRPVFTEREDGGWECVYLLEYSETGHSPSVFVQIRGLKAGTWSNFRLKLNFGSILSRQVLSTRAAALVYALIGNREPIKGLAADLATGQDFVMSFNRITLKYNQEKFDGSRYNLTGVNASRGW